MVFCNKDILGKKMVKEPGWEAEVKKLQRIKM